MQECWLNVFMLIFPSFSSSYVSTFAVIWSLSNHSNFSEVKRQKNEHVSLCMCAFAYVKIKRKNYVIM